MMTPRATSPDHDSSDGSFCLTPASRPTSPTLPKAHQAPSVEVSRRASVSSQASADPTTTEYSGDKVEDSEWEDIDEPEDEYENPVKILTDPRERMFSTCRLYKALSQALEDQAFPYVNGAIDGIRRKRAVAMRRALVVIEPVVRGLRAHEGRQPTALENWDVAIYQAQSVRASKEEQQLWTDGFRCGEIKVEVYVETMIHEYTLCRWKPCWFTDFGIRLMADRQIKGSHEELTVLSLLSDKRDEDWNPR